MKDDPCDACGKDTGCTCPPCPCRWCRYARGEATLEERRSVEAHMRAHAAADARRFARQESQKMGEKLRAYLGGAPS